MINYTSKNIIYNPNTQKFVNENFVVENFKKKKNQNYLGNFAFVKRQKEIYYCCRDKVGTKKIFYGINKKNKKLCFSENFIKLTKFCKSNSIRSISKGKIVSLSTSGKIIEKSDIKSSSFRNYYKTFKQLLTSYLYEVKKKHGNTCVVCLSSGLDSTIITYFAKKIFKKVITVNLYFNSVSFKTKPIENSHAINISKILKTEHRSVGTYFEEIFKKLDTILYSCQDWRDFNVHCAFLNFAVAKYLKKNKLKYPVLTGDIMNEYFADYQPEIIDKIKYYNQPNVSKDVLRKFYIKGLDSSDREYGVFEKFDLKLYQPYSILVDLYNNLPKKFYFGKNSKNKINSKLIPKKLLTVVSSKKIRAQTGDENGGVLNFFIKKKLNEKKLKDYFKKKFKLSEKWMNTFIISGLYRR